MTATDPLPDAGHLTEVFRGAGFSGDVRGVAVDNARDTVISRITRLRLTRDGDIPETVILKSGQLRSDGEAWVPGQQEVTFYQQVAPLMPPGLVPRCFEATWAPDAFRLLLEDLTDTHVIATPWPLPPRMDQCETILNTLARFHALWWDDPRLGVSVAHWPDAEVMKKRLGDFEARLGRFVDLMGDRLPRERRILFERYIQAAPTLSVNRDMRRQASIVHGDAHVWNFFLPRDDTADTARLFDWDS